MIYEQSAPTTNYANNLLMCANKLWQYNSQGLSDAQIKSDLMYDKYIKNNWVSPNRYRFYDSDTDFGGSSYQLNPTNINEQILDKNIHLLHYTGHGNIGIWATESSNYSNFYALQLTNKTPLVITTTACLSNAFDSSLDPCLGESFIRNPLGGAVCYWGSSRYGWDNDNFNLGASPKYAANFYIFLRLLSSVFPSHYADIVDLAKSSFIDDASTDGAQRWLQYALNALGDAEIPIYTANPKTFTDIVISRQDNKVIVSLNLPDAEVISSRITVSSTDPDFSYWQTAVTQNTYVFDNVPPEYNVIITANNYIPYIYSDPLYIQNEIFDNNRTYNARKVFVGKEVTTNKPEGEIIIQDGGHVVITATDAITLDTGVEIKLGGSLEINNNQTQIQLIHTK